MEKVEQRLQGRQPAQVGLALRRRERLGRAPRQSGAARAQAVPARQGLHRAQRRGRHHRRVHRPHDAGPALFGRPASGAGGQGAPADPAREPDARLDHVPELLPHVREARRHDRHGAHRGRRVPRHLQSRSARSADQHAAVARLDEDDEVYRTNAEKYRSIITLLEDCKVRGQPVLVGTTSIEKSEQLAEMLRQAGWEQHDFSDPNAFAALYTGDDGAKKTKVFAILNARYHEQEAYIVSPGRRAGRDHDRHQHGGPRHRHSARRQCRHAHPPGTRRDRGPARAR